MNLVFFADAVVHVTRISRVLRQPRGNAMLVGVGGSGKQSLTRIASYVAGYECFQIEINRGYGLVDFREDIKKLMVSGRGRGLPRGLPRFMLHGKGNSVFLNLNVKMT